MQTPCIQVSQLAASTSFFASILQPLKLRYLATESEAAATATATATADGSVSLFGTSHGVVLSLLQVPSGTAPNPSSIHISTPSHAAVAVFHSRGSLANPSASATILDTEEQATLFDLDGNKIQVTYVPAFPASTVLSARLTLVLDQVPAASAATTMLECKSYECPANGDAQLDQPSQPNVDDKQPTAAQEDAARVIPPSPSETGVSNVFSAFLGAAAGAAAGAALTYSLLSAASSSTSSSVNEERTMHPPPNGARRLDAYTVQPLKRRDANLATTMSERIRTEPKNSSTSGRLLLHNNDKTTVSSVKGSSEPPQQASQVMVRAPAAKTDMSVRTKGSALSSSERLKSEPASRQLALGPPSASGSTSTSNDKKKSAMTLVSTKHPRALSSSSQDEARARQHPHTDNLGSKSSSSASKLSVARSGSEGAARSAAVPLAAPSPSSVSAKTSNVHHGKNSRVDARKGTDSPHKRHGGSHAHDEKRSHVSARNVPLPPSVAGTSDCHDTVSHVSAKKSSLSNVRVPDESSTDTRSHVSARNVALPESVAGTSDYHDVATSQVSRKRSGLSARHMADEGLEDTHSHDSRSHVSARNIPIPRSVAGTNDYLDAASQVSRRSSGLSARHMADGSPEDTYSHDRRSHISARNIPLPMSVAGTSDCYDAVSSQVSRKRSDLSARNMAGSPEDRHSRVSARNVALPPSVAGTESVYNAASQVSRKRSDLSARNMAGSPEDRHSRVSARTVALPPSVAGTESVYDAAGRVSAKKSSASSLRIIDGDPEDTRSRVSARNVALPPSVAGTSSLHNAASHVSRRKPSASTIYTEDGKHRVAASTGDFHDTVSHFSARLTDMPVSGHHADSEDKRSSVSARNIPLPCSVAGTADYYDTVSHVSARTGLSGSPGSHHQRGDRRAHDYSSTAGRRGVAASHVSARNVPLPSSCAGDGSRAGTADSGCRVSAAARVPLPSSLVEGRARRWDDDDGISIAPSDSISCVASKGARRV